MGFSRRKLTLLLSGLLVAAIIIGLQTVGVILMSSMLIAPGVAARQWTNKLSMMLILAAFFGGVSGLIGTVLSSSITHMPTGPTIIIVISIFVLLSLIFAKNRGILWKLINQKKMKKDKNSISKGD